MADDGFDELRRWQRREYSRRQSNARGQRAAARRVDTVHDAVSTKPDPRDLRCTQPYAHAEFEAFQSLWRRYGQPELVAVKEATLAALLAGSEPGPLDDAAATRAERSILRVAARQAAHLIGASARAGEENVSA